MLKILRAGFQSLSKRNTSHLPALDALRALAVLMVVLMHVALIFEQKTGHQTHFTKFPLIRSGFYGVDLFFILSGFLIGTQLWREWQTTQSVNWFSFVFRRGMRIWPLYYATYLFIFFTSQSLNKKSYGISDLFFLTNYIPRGIIPGAWSLCIEEQFYLLAPLFIIIASKIGMNLFQFRVLLCLMYLCIPLIRLLTWSVVSPDFWSSDDLLWETYIYHPLHTHCDGLLVGLLLSNLFADATISKSTRQKTMILSLILAVVLGGLGMKFHKVIFGFTASSLVLGAVTWMALETSIGQWSVWRWRIFYWLSRLSYGMYLNHLLLCGNFLTAIIYLMKQEYISPLMQSILAAFVITTTSMAIATLSYVLIEFPALYYRDKRLHINS